VPADVGDVLLLSHSLAEACAECAPPQPAACAAALPCTAHQYRSRSLPEAMPEGCPFQGCG
jgi:hypothetical protein